MPDKQHTICKCKLNYIWFKWNRLTQSATTLTSEANLQQIQWMKYQRWCHTARHTSHHMFVLHMCEQSIFSGARIAFNCRHFSLNYIFYRNNKILCVTRWAVSVEFVLVDIFAVYCAHSPLLSLHSRTIVSMHVSQWKILLNLFFTCILFYLAASGL